MVPAAPSPWSTATHTARLGPPVLAAHFGVAAADGAEVAANAAEVVTSPAAATATATAITRRTAVVLRCFMSIPPYATWTRRLRILLPVKTAPAVRRLGRCGNQPVGNTADDLPQSPGAGHRAAVRPWLVRGWRCRCLHPPSSGRVRRAGARRRHGPARRAGARRASACR